MLFWIAASVMTLAACVAVMAPFIRKSASPTPDADHDLEVYRDQLAEVDRDRDRGLIDSAEAEQARAEIARRILRLEPDLDGRDRPPRGATVARVLVSLAVLAIPLVSWSIYATTGSPGYSAQPLAARLSKDPTQNTVEELVARAERHLSENPDDASGWAVLAPIYLRLQRYADAATAYRNAIRLGGASAALESGLGEAIAAAAGGIVSAEAAQAFERALELDPADAKARFFLAYGAAQEGRVAEAVDGWQALVSLEGADPRWVAAARSAMEEGRRRLAAAEAPGPSAEDVAAAEQMPEGDRRAMIETMVANLDDRLKENPADPEGWRRLIRSYTVLGRQDDARGALGRALDALGRDSSDAEELVAFADELGIREQGQ